MGTDQPGAEPRTCDAASCCGGHQAPGQSNETSGHRVDLVAEVSAPPADTASDETADEATQGPRSPDEHRAQGHWLLAKMGKRVLRPGGLELTRRLLEALQIGEEDQVVELGPGIGRTAQLVLAGRYRGYTAVEPNPQARAELARVLAGHHDVRCVDSDALSNGLPAGRTDAVISEAMLTMQPQADKQAIVAEAWRLLAPGGRWALHELALMPDDLDPAIGSQISKALSQTIKVGARPLTGADWRELLTSQGFRVEWTGHSPMRLVEPSRIIADEGLLGALRFFNNVRRNPAARTRIMAMRRIFRSHADHLGAIGLVVRKPVDPAPQAA